MMDFHWSQYVGMNDVMNVHRSQWLHQLTTWCGKNRRSKFEASSFVMYVLLCIL
jgi:hypothetical protein